jgi:hypothetical protein
MYRTRIAATKRSPSSRATARAWSLATAAVLIVGCAARREPPPPSVSSPRYVYFFDCEGTLLKLDLRTHRTVLHGKLSELTHDQVIDEARDGCVVHRAAVDAPGRRLLLRVQLRSRYDPDDAGDQSETIALALPTLEVLERSATPLESRVTPPGVEPAERKRLCTTPPFPSGRVFHPTGGRYVVYAETRAAAGPRPCSMAGMPEAEVSGSDHLVGISPVTGRFAAREWSSGKAVSTADHPDLVADPSKIVCVTPDASVFYATHDALYEIDLAPTPQLIRIERFELDGLWAGCVLADW